MKNSDLISTLSSSTVESILGKFSNVGQLPPAASPVAHEAKPPLASILKSSQPSPSASPTVSSRKVRIDVPDNVSKSPPPSNDGTFKIGFRRKPKSSTASESSASSLPSTPELGTRKPKEVTNTSSKVVATPPIVVKNSTPSSSNKRVLAITEVPVDTIPFPAMEFSNAACYASKEELLNGDKSLTVLSLCPLCSIQRINCHIGSHYSTSLRTDIRRIKVADLLLQHPLKPPTPPTSSTIPSPLSFEQALQIDLPFLLPILDPETAVLQNQRFQLAKAEYGPAVDSWLAYDSLPPTMLYPSSSSSHRIMDIIWWNVMKTVLPSANVHINHNQSYIHNSYNDDDVDNMLQELQLPDVVVSMNGRICLLVQSREMEWTHLLHAQAYKAFPSGQRCIPGITSTANTLCVHAIHYHAPTITTNTNNTNQNSVINPVIDISNNNSTVNTSNTINSMSTDHSNRSGVYSQRVVRSYRVDALDGRIDFIVDLLKLLRWMSSGVGELEDSLHIIPAVRRLTSSGHNVISWTKNGLHKQFHANNCIRFDLIRQIYNANLPFVERGFADHHSILITSVGNTLHSAVLHGWVTKQQVIESIRAAVDSIHALGIAHGDICCENVFVLDQQARWVVVLGDLQHCMEVQQQPHKGVKHLYGDPGTALELDENQFVRFLDDLNGYFASTLT
mmetsp:Transcript_23650/g.32466  ORF Transcript_23650/g.32466 Transcript_23650/m.32466 type:complete len:676 (+) Transcript_23650:95-2122(+)